jgi:putative ABC transport system permease protein
METLVHDVRYALRSLRKSPGFSFAVIATFALGIAATTAVFTVFNAVLLQPLGFPRADRLVRITNVSPKTDVRKRVTISWPDLADAGNQSGAFSSWSYAAQWHPALSGYGNAEILTGAAVDSGFFATLGIQPERGRFFVPKEDVPGSDDKAVISHALWMRKFGGAELIGKPLRIDGRVLTVAGIAPPFEDLHFHDERDVEIWTTLAPTPADWSRSGRSLVAVARLRNGVSLATARTRVAAVAARLRRTYPDDREEDIAVTPLQEMIVGDVRRPLSMLLAASALLLAIACFNIINLLLARTSRRAPELNLRVALGASPWHLLRRIAAEAGVLAAAGGVSGLLLANVIVRAFARVSAGSVPRMRALAVDQRVLLFAALATIGCAVIAAILPAIGAIRGRAIAARTSRGSSASRPAVRTQEALVVLQIAISVVVIGAAALLGRSLWNLFNLDKGIDERGVLTMHLRAPREDYPKREDFNVFYRDVVARLSAVPGVGVAGTTSILPLDGDWSCDGFSLKLDAALNEQCAEARVVGPGYLDAIGTHVVRGRGLIATDDANAPLVMLVDRVFAQKYFGSEDVIGRMVNLHRHPRRIVGVVEAARMMSVEGAPPAAMYTPELQDERSGRERTIVLRTAGDPRAVIGNARAVIRQISPNAPVMDVRTMRDVVSSALRPQRFRAWLVGGFAIAALLLATIGIAGVLSFATSLRLREIGIRLALGSTSGGIARLILWRATQLVAIGAALGIIGALLAGRSMEALLFGVGATDPATLAAVAAGLGACAIGAALLPAARAARVEPIAVLRAD